MTCFLLAEFWKQLPHGKGSIDEVLDYLIGTAQVKEVPIEHEITGKIERIEYKTI